jgi:hypothetical protein
VLNLTELLGDRKQFTHNRQPDGDFRLLLKTVAWSCPVSGKHQGKVDSAILNLIFRLAKKSHIIHNWYDILNDQSWLSI